MSDEDVPTHVLLDGTLRYSYTGTCYHCTTPKSCKSAEACDYPPSKRFHSLPRWDEAYAEAEGALDSDETKRRSR